jgi:hypothetical protein
MPRRRRGSARLRLRVGVGFCEHPATEPGIVGDELLELLSETVVCQQNAKIYPHIYPQWGIAFACVIDYTDSVELLLISAP